MGGLFSWFKKSSRTISVTFANTDGDPLFRSEVPSENLPETFVDLDTTFHIMDADWHVVRAEPMTAEEFIRSGKLTIVVHKVEAVSLADLRFSLPTIDTTWAFTLEDGPDDGYILNLHEDDWRQHEFFPAADEGAVQEEMNHIIAIWRNNSERSDEGCSFSACHKRTIPAPALGISVTDILALLQPVSIGVVAIRAF